jgi:hypothetical protein
MKDCFNQISLAMQNTGICQKELFMKRAICRNARLKPSLMVDYTAQHLSLHTALERQKIAKATGQKDEDCKVL